MRAGAAVALAVGLVACSATTAVDPTYVPTTGPERDVDGDGLPDLQDCAPADPDLQEDDADGDGWTTCGGDCDDADSAVHPGAEDPDTDGLDADCDGSTGPGEVIGVEEVASDGTEVHGDPARFGAEFGPFPLEEGTYQPLGTFWWEPGQLGAVAGRIDEVVQETWDGDADAYRLNLMGYGPVWVSLDWTEEATDLDLLLYCWYADTGNSPGWYFFPTDPVTFEAAKPEEGWTTLYYWSGMDCFYVIVGYSGEPTDYRLLVMQADAN